MLPDRLSTRTLIILLIISFLAFFFISALYIDPDFGWELMTGRYILQHGFPATDPFSYTMPNYPIILHSWLPEVLYAILFPLIGYLGLAAISASVFIGVTFALQKSFSFKMVSLLLFLTTMLQYADVRPQVFSWLFFAWLLFIIYSEDLWRKFKWLIPIIFFVWVNSHGAFALGLVILGLHIGLLVFQKRAHRSDLLLLGASFGATFLNPYGTGIWREVFLTFGDPQIRSNISEWIPTMLRMSLIDVLVVVIPSVFAAKYFRSFSLSQRVIFIVTLLAGLSSLKLLPFFVIAAIPMLNQALSMLHTESKEKKTTAKFNLFMKGLLLIVAVASIINISLTIISYNNLSEDVFYPKKAVLYLQNHPPQKQLFSSFSWAGYVLWKLPNFKLFVDGRMPFWKAGKLQARVSPSSGDALADYHAVLDGDLDILSQQGVNTILYHNNPIHKKFYLVLEKAGWKKIYSDNVSVIYIRPPTSIPAPKSKK